MPDPLDELRTLLLDEDALVRAIASGRRRGEPPPWRRVDLRYVDLRAGRQLQVTRTDTTQAHTTNHPPGEEAVAVIEEVLALPFGDWRVETTSQVVQLRVTKGGKTIVHREQREAVPSRTHDRAKALLLPTDDPLFRAIGITDAAGRIKPSRQAKARQVEEFVRHLDAALDDAWAGDALRRPTAADPLRVADLGSGNAYLTFAAARHLTRRAIPAVVTGVDVKPAARERNERIARDLDLHRAVTFVRGEIGAVDLDPAPEVVLALHACDTATDDALGRAIGWAAPLVLAAPCCHRDVARQLRRRPQPYPALTRHGILRERFADTLTDALRAAIMRNAGYRVEVTEFVESRHTPRNTLLRAVRTGAPPSDEAAAELAALTTTWDVRPALQRLLDDR